MREYGEYGSTTYTPRFDTWSAAVDSARVEPERSKHVEDCDLISELRELHDKHGKVTAKVMRNDGEYSPPVYQRRFDSWNEALKTAGVEANKKQILVFIQLRMVLRRN